MSAPTSLRSIELIRGSSFDDIYIATGFTAANAATPSVNSGNAGQNGGTSFNEPEGMGGNDSITGNGNTPASAILMRRGRDLILSSPAKPQAVRQTDGGV